jgi:hypothetical protein
MDLKNKPIQLFALALIAALSIFYFPYLCRQQSFYLTDITNYFEPLIKFMANTLSCGRFPAWNPLTYCGMSQLAIPSPGIFYPPGWLFFVLSFNQALALTLIFHQLIAGLGCFLLICSLGWGVFPAIIAGIVFALNGYMFSLQTNFTLVCGVAWFPLCIWSMRELHLKEAFSYKLFFSVCLFDFLLFTSGRPEVVAPVTLLLLTLVATFFYSDIKQAGNGRSLTKLIEQLSPFLLALMLAAPAILPVLEWLSLSPRAQGFETDTVFAWSANWYDCLCLFAAQPLGNLNVFGNRLAPLVTTFKGHLPFVASALVGPITLTLAIKALFDQSWRWRYLILSFFLLSVALAMGNNTPLAPWLLTQLPAVSLVRYPVKLLFLPVFALTLLAARGAFLTMNKDKQVWGEIAPWAFWAGVLLAGLILYALSASTVANTNHVLQATALAQNLIARGLFLAALLGICTSGIISASKREKLSLRASTTSLCCLLFASLLLPAFIFLRYATDKDFFQQPSFLALQLRKLEHIDDNGLPFKPRILTLPVNSWYHTKDVNSATANWYQYKRQLLLPNTHLDFAIPTSGGYEASVTNDYQTALWAALASADFYNGVGNTGYAKAAFDAAARELHTFCQLTATKYLITQSYSQAEENTAVKPIPLLPDSEFSLAEEDKATNVRLYKIVNNLPRAYLTYSWRFTDNHAFALQDVIDISNSGFDPTLVTIVESKDSNLAKADLVPAKATGAIECTKELPEQIDLNVTTSKPGLLVLADQYYPGWQAVLDDKPTEIYRANAIERAVFIPAGTHRLTFMFKPLSLTIGVILSLVAMTILLLMILPSLFKVRTKR